MVFILGKLQGSELAQKLRTSRKFLILIVYIALFLDNMLLTTVVPIIPEYLYLLKYPNESLLKSDTVSTTPQSPETTTHVPQMPLEPPPKPVVLEPDMAMDLYDNVPKQMQPVDYDYVGHPQYQPDRKRRHKRQDYMSDYENDDGPVEETTTVQSKNSRRVEQLNTENVEVGLMFGSKALLQLITNPFVGPLTNRLGYTIPMFSGFVIMFCSTVLFAFGSSFSVLFIARTLQGVGSACTSTSGMGMIAQAYPDDQERGSAMGVALGGLALGVLIGPPYGGLLYDWSGKELPFILLALLALFDGTLQLIVLKPEVTKGESEAASMKQLIKDPYILICTGAITIGNLGIAMLEPTLPIWMIQTMDASSTMRGAAFLPASISYLVGTNIFGPLAHKIGRWLSTMIGLIIIGACLIAIPSATSVAGLIAPNGFMGLGIGMIDASMFPQMGYLVDLRHVGVYGGIYAIADAAFCLAFAVGPYLGGPTVRNLGFPTMLYIIAGINFLYAPLLYFLRNPPANVDEKQVKHSEKKLIENDDTALRYEPFGEEDNVSMAAEYERNY